jgi:trans-aconitate 2-methyltransferase
VAAVPHPEWLKRQDEVERYYDDHVPRKLRDFLHGNRRVDAAWQSIAGHVSGPLRILEVGCGVGYVSARMRAAWPAADILAVDLSPTSIEVARRLFGDTGVRFECTRLEELPLEAPCDVIVLMDVYEHIEVTGRNDFHRAVAGLMGPAATLFLSFPTPEYQAHLRAHEPHKVQPVDEDISAADLDAFAHDCGAVLEQHSRISVWRRFDYAHAWIRRTGAPPLERVELAPPLPDEQGHRERRELIASRLGAKWVDAADQA